MTRDQATRKAPSGVMVVKSRAMNYPMPSPLMVYAAGNARIIQPVSFLRMIRSSRWGCNCAYWPSDLFDDPLGKVGFLSKL